MEKSKTNFIVKGVAAACAFLTSMMLLCAVISNSFGNANLFDCWDGDIMEMYGTSFSLMVVCFAVAFFLGLVMAVAFVINMFMNNAKIEKILHIAGIVLAVAVVAGLVCTFVFCGTDHGRAAKFGAGIGAILATVFGVATCAMTFAGRALKK